MRCFSIFVGSLISGLDGRDGSHCTKLDDMNGANGGPNANSRKKKKKRRHRFDFVLFNKTTGAVS
jgi:hypothetical protein